MSRIIDAVSIVLTCGDEMFVVQRQYFLKAFPGYWAFPGGKVEDGDEAFTIQHPLLNGIDGRLFGAVVREGEEELGIDLRKELAAGRVSSVDLLGLAITPDFNPYRFATYFFKINLTEKRQFVIDKNEARIANWRSSEDLLREFNSGQILAVPPVIKVIETLGINPEVRTIPDLNFIYDNDKHVPTIESIRGMRQLMPLSHTLPPATRTNAFLIGDEGSDRIIVDPSPADEGEYQKFLNTIKLWGVDKVLITHQHPDHHEHADRLARELGLPILLTAYTRKRIEQRQAGFFDELETIIISEGDVVAKWLGRDVLIMEIPGHDEGQVALYASDLSWLIAGDLFQGIGTVVIGGEEGDMQKYFQTLEKIIQLSPRVIFPSHGIGLGGTTVLERTLDHRRNRETQILAFHSEGHTPEEMLPLIYKDVDQNLWPYALENIRKHLDKLKQERRIR